MAGKGWHLQVGEEVEMQNDQIVEEEHLVGVHSQVVQEDAQSEHV